MSTLITFKVKPVTAVTDLLLARDAILRIVLFTRNAESSGAVSSTVPCTGELQPQGDFCLYTELQAVVASNVKWCLELSYE
jgi:hypothetical protein